MRNEISLSVLKSSAYGASEEAKRKLLDDGESEPSGFEPDAQRLAHWQQCYGDLWQLKIAFEKDHNR